MSRHATIACLLLGCSLCGGVFADGQVPDGHPLIGKWQWTRAANNCTELYDFRKDGTVPVTSGAERTENTYSVVASPDRNGFYKATIKTTKDYGGRDCIDNDAESTGQQTIIYIVFDAAKTVQMMCFDASLKRCIGPLQRLPD
ncbi:MAG: hypothetical protein ABI612_10815 [Betaproteobacteria bacterium]